MKRKTAEFKKGLKVQAQSNLKGMNFKVRKAKKIEHASMCADTPTFNFGV